MEEKKSKRGGYRPNAGRPQTNRKSPLAIRVSEEALQRLNQLTRNKSEYIDQLIMAQPL